MLALFAFMHIWGKKKTMQTLHLPLYKKHKIACVEIQFFVFSNICNNFKQFIQCLFLDTTVYIPSFDGTSYLELQPLGVVPRPSEDGDNRASAAKDTTLLLTVKARSTQGSILFSEYNFCLKLIVNRNAIK